MMLRVQSSYSKVISISLVKQYSYCPVIPWINQVLGYVEDPTPSMDLGRVDASYKEEVARELKLPRPWRIEVPLHSINLGVGGVVDIIAGDGRFTVVEVKAFRRSLRRSRHFRDQLMLYALLVNEVLGPVRDAILYMGGLVYRFTVTQHDLDRMHRLINSVRRIIDSESPPRPKGNARKCGYCWYRRVCPNHP